MPMQAQWNGRVIASSDDIVTVDGNAYFPLDSLDSSCIRPSSHTSVCGWKELPITTTWWWTVR